MECTFKYDGRLWKPSPTTQGRDSFFHAAFGGRIDENPYIDKHAKVRRMRWAAFLTYFENETLPSPLADILHKCFCSSQKYKDASEEDNVPLENYAADIMMARRDVEVEEIPVLATLENIKIVVLSKGVLDPLVVEPNLELLGDYLTDQKPKEEVVLYLEDNIFSRLDIVQEFQSIPGIEPLKDAHMPSGYWYDKGGSAGSKGVEYQVGILTIFLLNSLRRLKNWRLSTENTTAGKFDDAVLECPEGAVLLQAKHKESKTRKVTLEQLVSTNTKNDDFSLPKYFLSYMEIKTKFNIKNVIICTNTSVDERSSRFLKSHNAQSNNMLFYGHNDCLYYTFKDEILPDLRENVRSYCETNLRKKGLDEATSFDKDLKEFLDCLQFYCNYPTGNDMSRTTEELLSFTKRFKPSCGHITQGEIYTKLMDWFQQKNGVYLTETYTNALFAEIWRDRRWEALKGYNVHFQRDNISFSNTRIIHIHTEDSYVLQEIRIWSVLKGYKPKVLYAGPDDSREMTKQVIEAFELPQYLFLVAVWPRTTDESKARRIGGKLAGILDKYQYKRVIFVTGDTEWLRRSELYNNNNNYDVSEPIRFQDLSKETREMLLKKKNIVFQGEEVCLEELLTEAEYGEVLDPGTLEKLVLNETIRVGSSPLDLDENVSRYYIRRVFTRSVLDIDTWKISKELTLLHDIKEKLVLISDRPGSGKTTALTQLAYQYKRRHRHRWVIQVELNEYTRILKEAVTNHKETLDIKEFLNSKAATKFTNYLEEGIFSLAGKVILMLDGFDEVSPDYDQLTVNMIFQCVNAANFWKIFITTRPHIQKGWAGKLGVTPFVLVPFEERDQVAFLTNYWAYSLKLEDKDRDKSKKFAEALVGKMFLSYKEVSEPQNHFASIPLHVRMLAEVFQENGAEEETSEWEGCKEYLAADVTDAKLPGRMNITKLYEMFVEKKQTVFLDKANPSGNTAANDALKDQFDKCLSYHRSLALEEILGDKTRCELFSQYKSRIETSESSILKMGILQKLDTEVRFVHRTFAEYFVAQSLLMELKLQNQSADFQRYFINILTKRNFVTICTFLDGLLQNVVEDLPSNTFQSYQTQVTDENILDNFQIRFIHILAEEGFVDILRFILKCIGFKIVRNKYASIFSYRLQKDKAAYKFGNMLNTLQHYIQRAGLNIFAFRRQTPLHAACTTGHLAMVKFLVSQGADLNTNNYFKKSPLSIAIQGSHFDIVTFLLEEGADIEGDRCYWYLPTMVREDRASAAGYVLDRLLERDGLLITKAEVPYTAAYLGRLDLINTLVGKGLDINCRTMLNSETLLFGAARGGQQQIIHYLIFQGCEVDDTDKKGNTALHVVAARDQVDIARLLVQVCHADASIANEEGYTALDLACEEGNLGTVRLLMDCGGDRYGRTALHAAVRKGRLGVAELLVIKYGVYVNVKDAEGFTPLHLALKMGYLEIARLLVEFGADVDVRDGEGRKALDLASVEDRLHITEFLREGDINI